MQVSELQPFEAHRRLQTRLAVAQPDLQVEQLGSVDTPLQPALLSGPSIKFEEFCAKVISARRIRLLIHARDGNFILEVERMSSDEAKRTCGCW